MKKLVMIIEEDTTPNGLRNDAQEKYLKPSSVYEKLFARKLDFTNKFANHYHDSEMLEELDFDYLYN
jgi:hypothetical protein